jgi:hypothetical protein
VVALSLNHYRARRGLLAALTDGASAAMIATQQLAIDSRRFAAQYARYWS